MQLFGRLNEIMREKHLLCIWFLVSPGMMGMREMMMMVVVFNFQLQLSVNFYNFVWKFLIFAEKAHKS